MKKINLRLWVVVVVLVVVFVVVVVVVLVVVLVLVDLGLTNRKATKSVTEMQECIQKYNHIA